MDVLVDKFKDVQISSPELDQTEIQEVSTPSAELASKRVVSKIPCPKYEIRVILSQCIPAYQGLPAPRTTFTSSPHNDSYEPFREDHFHPISAERRDRILAEIHHKSQRADYSPDKNEVSHIDQFENEKALADILGKYCGDIQHIIWEELFDGKSNGVKRLRH